MYMYYYECTWRCTCSSEKYIILSQSYIHTYFSYPKTVCTCIYILMHSIIIYQHTLCTRHVHVQVDMKLYSKLQHINWAHKSASKCAHALGNSTSFLHQQPGNQSCGPPTNHV